MAESNNKKTEPKVVSIHQERCIQIFDYLIEHNAKISVEVSTDLPGEKQQVVYSKDNSPYDLIELVSVATGLDRTDEKELSKIYDFFRDSYLIARDNGAFKRIHEARKDVIKNIELVFNDKNKSDDESEYAQTKHELFITKDYKRQSAQNIQNVYPSFYDQLYNTLCGYFESPAKIFNLNDLLHSDFLPPLSPLFTKIYMNLPEVSEEIEIRFKEITDRYKERFKRNLSLYKNSTIPSPGLLADYGYVDIPFDICARKNPIPTLLKKGPHGHEIMDEYEIESKFDNPTFWFEGIRYQKLKLAENELLNTNLKNWPKYTLEHVILTQVEFKAVTQVIRSIAENEVDNNIRLKVFTGNRKGFLDLQRNLFTIDELSHLLLEYHITNLNDHIHINGSSIISKPIIRFPNIQIADQLYSKETIESMIKEKLMNALIKEISNNICFNYTDTYFNSSHLGNTLT